MKCPKCGYENKDDASACGLCAEVLRARSPESQARLSPAGGAAASSATGPAAPASIPSTGSGPLFFEIQKQKLEMPAECACCLGPAEDSLELAVEEQRPGAEQGQMISSSWNIPYCAVCAKHVRMHDRTLAGGVGAGIVAGLVVLGVKGFTAASAESYVFAVGVGVGVALAGGFFMRGVLARGGARCVATGPAVNAKPAGAYAGERFKFIFRNPAFGRQVAELNRAGTIVSG